MFPCQSHFLDSTFILVNPWSFAMVSESGHNRWHIWTRHLQGLTGIIVFSLKVGRVFGMKPLLSVLRCPPSLPLSSSFSSLFRWHFSAFHTPCCASLAVPVLSSQWVFYLPLLCHHLFLSLSLFLSAFLSPLSLSLSALPHRPFYSLSSFLSPLDLSYFFFFLYLFLTLCCRFFFLCLFFSYLHPSFFLAFLIPYDGIICQLVSAYPWPQHISIFSSSVFALHIQIHTSLTLYYSLLWKSIDFCMSAVPDIPIFIFPYASPSLPHYLISTIAFNPL